MARICAQCGNLLYDQSTVCAVCGTPVPAQPAQPVYSQQPVNSYPQQPGNGYQQQPNYGYPQQPNYGYPQQPNYGYPQQPVYVKPKTPGRGFGITSLVLGIVGLVFSIYYVFYIPTLGLFVEKMGYAIEDGWGDPGMTEVFESSVTIGIIIGLLIYASLSIMALCFAPAAKKRGYCNKIQQGGMITGAIGCVFWAIAMILALAL